MFSARGSRGVIIRRSSTELFPELTSGSSFSESASPNEQPPLRTARHQGEQPLLGVGAPVRGDDGLLKNGIVDGADQGGSIWAVARRPPKKLLNFTKNLITVGSVGSASFLFPCDPAFSVQQNWFFVNYLQL